MRSPSAWYTQGIDDDDSKLLERELVAKLAKAKSVQITLRLPAADLGKAREIAERKGIGYQTLLKMIVHEGLQRAAQEGR